MAEDPDLARTPTPSRVDGSDLMIGAGVLFAAGALAGLAELLVGVLALGIALIALGVVKARG